MVELKQHILFALLLYLLQLTRGQESSVKNLVCYYDMESSQRYGYASFTSKYLNQSVKYCSHVVYASAHMDAKTYDIYLPVKNQIADSYKPRNLKKLKPQLKVYLSIGGDRDDKDSYGPLKYLHFLESSDYYHRRFITKTMEILHMYQFDGLDLALPLPRNTPQDESNLGAFLKDINPMGGGEGRKAETANVQYRHVYSKFVTELKKECDKNKFDLTMTVLPNVNSSDYYDVAEIHKHFKFINLFAFDFNTPERSPSKADYSAPLYFNPHQNRLPYANADFQIKYWLQQGCPAKKLNLGIATYGRAWKLTTRSGLSGKPIVEDTDGPGGYGNNSLLSWPSICRQLSHQRRNERPLTERTDTSYGNYAFRPANARNAGGIWISYDGPKFAATKVSYAKQKDLGGVVIYDLSRDDFRGLCHNIEFPILKSIREKLIESQPKQTAVIRSRPKSAKTLIRPAARQSRNNDILKGIVNTANILSIWTPQ
ncbi:chitinase-like protein Idgf1 [Musca autumnalis]|uniref:chitinase-like protein Idgf1 n=1 Tax=Musca autumnalis TaxID=221902 RepID=UPI003CEF1C5C